VLVGSVLAEGGGRLSVLKENAPYPGDLNDETQWIPAQRLEKGVVVTDELQTGQYGIWVLPAQIHTRALRFSHVAKNSDPMYGGSMDGAYVLSSRYANLAPQARASTSSTTPYARRLIDERDNGWGAWENNAFREGTRNEAVSEQHPEWVVLNWATPVLLGGLASLGSGFSAADIQVYAGPVDRHPSLAKKEEWKTIKSISGWKSLYPGLLPVHWVEFENPVTTRAIRLRIAAPLDESGFNPNLLGKTNGGKRVWLDELMALTPLDAAELKSAVLPTVNEALHAPIPINFTLPEDGYATLVIDDSQGRRVRNLVSDTLFSKGENTVYWDGTDDLLRDADAASHGVYHIPAELVAPGSYQVRGLWHRQIDLRYEFSVYAPGDPPWPTADGTGGWMTNHTPATCVAYIPASRSPVGQALILIGAPISEGGSALSWVDLDGKKLGGRGWIGGVWTGAQFLATDRGPNAEKDVTAYAASAFDDPAKNRQPSRVEVRLTKLTTLMPAGDRAVLKEPIFIEGRADPTAAMNSLGGLAAWNGILVLSRQTNSALVFIDARTGVIVSEVSLTSPGPVAFDPSGRLLAVSGSKLLRFPAGMPASGSLVPDSVVLIKDLEEPRGISVDGDGNIYISDQGKRHQVMVYSPDGILIRTIGHAGSPTAGPYDAQHMNHPRGLATDSHGHLWVAEEDFQPKRVSVWHADGTLWKAVYGPAQYGGGGALDPSDATRFSYNGMDFRLDWANGRSELERIYYRSDAAALPLPERSAPPEATIHIGGRRYMGNAFNSNPTSGSQAAFLFLDKGGIAVPVAGAGNAGRWKLLLDDAFASRWPRGTLSQRDRAAKPAFFLWSDLNGDGQVQPEEVQIWAGNSGGVTIAADGSFLINNVRADGEPAHALRYRPLRFTDTGAPLYGSDGDVLADAQASASSGGDQVLPGTDSWVVLTTAPPPYSNYGLGGARNGAALWGYPSLWPGLHASHSSPAPDMRGELIGTTRLLGNMVSPKNSDAGPLFFINGNQGNIYTFTQDGLFVAQLFQDVRQGLPWQMPNAVRGMVLNDVSLHDENFFPTINQTPDGNIYLVTGAHTAIARVNGLEGIRRLPAQQIHVSTADADAARIYVEQRESQRQVLEGKSALDILVVTTPPALDAVPEHWPGESWGSIDQRGVAAYFNSQSAPYDVQGALVISDNSLYAFWKTGDPQLLANTGDSDTLLFTKGGALDLMVGADPEADPTRTNPVAGDSRLLVTTVKGKVRAELYRAVVPRTSDAAATYFGAPEHSVRFDSVTDVTDHVRFASDGKGDFEIAVPLRLLGLDHSVQRTVRGDIGILRGRSGQTTDRVYWSNKSTALVSDIPSEAELTPHLWGLWNVKPLP